jgi:multidrug efflux system membrane fusion protein
LKAEFPNAENQLFPGQYVPVRLEVGVDTGALVVPTAAVQRGPDGTYVWLVTDHPPPGSSAEPKSSASTGKHARKPTASGKPADQKPPRYVKMQAVTTGNEAGDTGLIITKGLKAGDLVVTAGQFRLKQGSKVLPMKPGEIPPPPTTTEIKAAAQKGGGRRRR